MALDSNQMAGVVGGASNLIGTVVEGVNPVGRYDSTGFYPSNDVNSLFQQGMNAENRANKYNYGKTIGGATMAGASIGTSIMPGIGTAIGAVGGALVGGAASIFGSQKMERKTALANMKTAQNLVKENQQLESNQIFNARLNPMNYAANGGLMEINVGGKHEDNPYGGVPFSMSRGVTNGAEEGETLTKVGGANRVYSDRIKLTKGIIKMTGLDKNLIGKTPAEASKIINNKFIADKVSGKDAILPMDKIRRNGLLPKLDDIFMAQEVLKEQKGISNNNSNQMAMGGTTLRNTKNRFFVLNGVMNPFAKGGSASKKPWWRGPTRISEASDRQNAALKNETWGSAIKKAQNNLDTHALGSIFKMLDPTGVTSWSDAKKALSDGKLDYNDILQPLGAIPIVGKTTKAVKYVDSAIRALNLTDDLMIGNKFSGGGSIHIDPSKKGTFTAAATKHGKGIQEFARQVLANKDNYSPGMVRKANFARNASKWNAYGDEINPFELSSSTPEKPIIYTGGPTLPDMSSKYNSIQQPNAASKTTSSGIDTDYRSPNPMYNTSNNYSDWMKYAPVLGNAVQALDLAFEKPETTKMDRVSMPSKASKIPMKYIDTRPYINQLEKAQRTTASQIKEASGGNRAQYMANVIGSDLGYAGKYGDVRAQADEGNWQRYVGILSANNALDAQYNQQRLAAEQLNAGLAFQESDINARNRAVLSNMRRGASQSIFSNLGAIGQERENVDIMSKYFGYNPITGKRVK